jgi:poly(A) polymerase
MNPVEKSALDALRDATRGSVYENRLFLVGGYVRDKVMGTGKGAQEEPHPNPLLGKEREPEKSFPDQGTEQTLDDIDIVLEGDAPALARFLHEKGVSEIAPVVFPRFGTAMLRVNGRQVELATARIESYAPDSRKPDDVRPGTLLDDAMRRDFTINTLLENLHTGEIADPTGKALADISAGLIRTPAEPKLTFTDDPLRMLRAVRFAARFDFTIDPMTWAAIQESAERLAIVSRERVRDEFCKMLMTTRPAAGMNLLRESGLIAEFAPELLEMVGVNQNNFHAYPVWEHTLAVLSNLPEEATLDVRLAALFHDTGKPRTRTVDPGGRVHFYHHQDVSEVITRLVMTRLKFANDETQSVCRLVLNHMRIGEYSPAWSDGAVRRLIRDMGGQLDDLFAIHAADVGALAPEFQSTERARDLRARMAVLQEEHDATALTSPLDGDAIMQILGIEPGRMIRDAKEFLTNEVVEGRLAPDDVEGATEMVKEWFGRAPKAIAP